MKRKFILPILAAIVGLVVVFGVSAFKGAPKKDTGKFTTYYFQFSGTNIEAQYEDSTKWTVLPSNPGSDPCDGENIYVCVMSTPDLASGTRTALVTYLAAQTSAKTYCNEAAHVKWQRENP
ncbi:MAG: hypothetical protein WDO71_08820 [Bacteroidota bacterium]